MAVMQADHAVTACGKVGRMCHHDKRGAMLVRKTQQKFHDRRSVRGVEVAGRFVRQKDAGTRGKGARQGDALLLATRHLRGIMIGAMAKPHGFEFGKGTFERVTMPGQLQRRGDVFKRRHGRDQVKGLEYDAHVIAAEPGEGVLVQRGQIMAKRGHAARGGAFQPAHDHQQRGFPGTGRSDQAQRFPGADIERDPVQDFDHPGIALKAETYIFEGKNGIRHRRVLLLQHLTYGLRLWRSKGFAAVLVAAGVSTAPAQAAEVNILALGDSLTAGYGLIDQEGFVPQLRAWLAARDHDVRIVNAGVSGDTTAGGLSRVEWSLSPEIDALIVALGGNDLLRGIAPEVSRENLQGILEVAQARSLEVLLIGMEAPGNYGPEYKAAFDAIYPELAEEYGTLYLESFFVGLLEDGGSIAEMTEFMQPDGIHPNGKGVARIVEAIGPKVEALIERVQD